jgi:calcium-dependent protein kinase
MIQKNERKIEDVYNIEKKAIGTGGFGVVSKCVHKETKQERAVKTVSKKKIKNMEKFKQEIVILQ